MPEIAIAGRRIGPDRPPFVMAEVGINHEGEFRKAAQMVDAPRGRGGLRQVQCHITHQEMLETDMRPGEISSERLWTSSSAAS